MIKPITTEKAVRLVELNNTLTILAERKISKTEIKKYIEENFKVRISSINSLIHGNKKIFYVKLNPKNPAIDIATKLGMI